MSARLVIGGYDADITDGVPFPITYTVADVKNPEQRKRSSSKTIKLPDTSRNREIFKTFFLLNVSKVEDLSGIVFNPTERVEVQYYFNEILLFNGLIRLMDVDVVNGNYSFNCIMFSDFVNLFKDLGDKKVSELDWSEYTHTLNKTNIANSWDTSVLVNGVPTSNFTVNAPIGFGYCYPIVDWGYISNIKNKTINTNQLIPMVYAKEVLEKCFEEVGLTVDSDFMSGAAGNYVFRKLLLSWEGGTPVGLTQAQRDALFVDVSYSPLSLTWGETERNIKETFENGGLISNIKEVANGSLLEPQVTTTVTTDPSSQVNTDTGEVTAFYGGKYRADVTIGGNVTFSLDDYTNYNWIKSAGLAVRAAKLYITIFKNGSRVGESVTDITVTGTESTDLTAAYSINPIIDFTVSSGDVISFGTRLESFDTGFYFVGANNTGTNRKLEYTVTSGVDITLTNLDAPYEDGIDVDLSRFVPNMKCTDFLSGIFRMFNLYMSDPDNDGVVFIEPQDEYYSSTNDFDDWSDKIDYSRPQKIQPMVNLIDANEFVYKFAEDKDFLNEQYFESYGERYGDYSYNTGNELSKKSKEIKLPFSVGVPDEVATDFIIPRIIKVDGSGVVKPHKGKPRLYVYNGLYTAAWKFRNSAGGSSSNETDYPQVNHIEDLDSPISDLLWSYPQFIYWNQSTYTTNNLFQYYEKGVKESTGADAKLWSTYVKLSPLDIFTLDFRKLKMVDGTLYRLNTVKDYDVQNKGTVQVELLKVIEANKSGGTSGDGTGKTDDTDPAPPPSGGPIMEFYQTQPIATLIAPIEDRYPQEVLLTDNDATDNTITLPEPTKSAKVTIKKISSNNIPLFVQQNATDTIDGNASLKLIRQYESRTLISDGTDWYII